MREDIINGILDMCSRDMYKNTQDFAWLVSVLVDLAKTRGSHTGEAISQRLIDITLRVPAVRLITVNYVLPLLLQPDSVCESMKCVLIISLNSGGPSLTARRRVDRGRVLGLSPAGPDRQRLRLARLALRDVPRPRHPGHVRVLHFSDA